MRLFNWFRKRRKKIDEKKELLERTSKLQTEIEMRMKKNLEKGRRVFRWLATRKSQM